jgi:hypothetical protein
VDLRARRGETVTLDAGGSTDPDGHTLAFRWWQDRPAGTSSVALDIRGSDPAVARLVVPAVAVPGETLHVICQVTDGGTPQLTRYQRVVVTVSP